MGGFVVRSRRAESLFVGHADRFAFLGQQRPAQGLFNHGTDQHGLTGRGGKRGVIVAVFVQPCRDTRVQDVDLGPSPADHEFHRRDPQALGEGGVFAAVLVQLVLLIDHHDAAAEEQLPQHRPGFDPGGLALAKVPDEADVRGFEFVAVGGERVMDDHPPGTGVDPERQTRGARSEVRRWPCAKIPSAGSRTTHQVRPDRSTRAGRPVCSSAHNATARSLCCRRMRLASRQRLFFPARRLAARASRWQPLPGCLGGQVLFPGLGALGAAGCGGQRPGHPQTSDEFGGVHRIPLVNGMVVIRARSLR